MARKTWPQFSDRYWYIDWGFGTIGVESDYYDGSSIDDDRLNIGNCYRTKLEAEQAKDRVLAALKPVPAHETFPKLTVAIFDRPDCPDWCDAAVVSSCGIAYWIEGDFETAHQEIPGQFDASDWRNSLIKRPEKQLPDWCKVGAWVYDQNGDYFCKIIEIFGDRKSFTATRPGKNYTIGSGDLNYGFDKWKPARLRPWTFEEAPVDLKVHRIGNRERIDVLELSLDFCREEPLLVFSYAEKKYFSFSDILTIWELLDGSPCGVLEVVEE